MKLQNMIVKRAPGLKKSNGLLQFENHIWPCLLGKNGITTRKKEGDMKTPAGTFPLLFSFHNKKNLPFVSSGLPVRHIRDDDGWCDAPFNANYNRPIKLPYHASHEELMRQDHLYDIIIVMDHNYSTRINGRGSAVFFHLTDKKDHTAGCIAVEKNVMKFLLPRVSHNTRMIIEP